MCTNIKNINPAEARDKARLRFAAEQCPAIFNHIILPLLDDKHPQKDDACQAAKCILSFLGKIDPCPRVLENDLLQTMQIAQADPNRFIHEQDKVMKRSPKGSVIHAWAKKVVEFTLIAAMRLEHNQGMERHCHLMLCVIFFCFRETHSREN